MASAQQEQRKTSLAPDRVAADCLRARGQRQKVGTQSGRPQPSQKPEQSHTRQPPRREAPADNHVAVDSRPCAPKGCLSVICTTHYAHSTNNANGLPTAWRPEQGHPRTGSRKTIQRRRRRLAPPAKDSARNAWLLTAPCALTRHTPRVRYGRRGGRFTDFHASQTGMKACDLRPLSFHVSRDTGSASSGDAACSPADLGVTALPWSKAGGPPAGAWHDFAAPGRLAPAAS